MSCFHRGNGAFVERLGLDQATPDQLQLVHGLPGH